MRRLVTIWMLAGAAVAGAEIIDRIAVTLGGQVITASDLDRELRVAAFLDRRKPDFSPASRRKTADRLVEQRLVRREVELSRFPTPEASEVEPALAKFKQENYPAAADYARALAEAGVTETDVREHILWRLTLLRFIDVRFRPGVQVSDEDIAGYFQKRIVPEVRAANPSATPLLDDYYDRVVEILTSQQVDAELDAWIAEARQRASVEFRKEIFEP